MFATAANFADILRAQAQQRADRVAYIFLADGDRETARLTYYELDAQAQAIAGRLQSLAGKGERILLLYPPGLEFITAFFGCLYAGAIAVPVYPPRPNRTIERLQAIVADADAAFALTTTPLLATIEKQLGPGIRCLASDRVDASWAEAWREPGSTPESLAFLQYTSGSTGTPKGVAIAHSNLLYNSYLIDRGFQVAPGSVGVSWLPPYHDMGLIGGILQPVYAGASVVLLPPVSFLQRPQRWLAAISRYKATTSGGPNFGYELCLNQITPQQKVGLDLSHWELAFTGAEPVRVQTLERFSDYFADCGFRREAFYPCYGMAEATLIISGGDKQAAPLIQFFQVAALERNQAIAATDAEPSAALVGCGQTLEGQEIVIVNPETHHRCATEEIGEIWVRGQSIAQGYWRREAQTEAAFHAYLADSNEGPFLRTGDLGFLQGGELFVTGRLKDLIIIRGRNHYPQDIELTVEQSHPALRVASSAAFSLEVAGEERLVIAAEVKRSALRNLAADEAIAAIRTAVVSRHELQPHTIVLLKTGSLPKTSSGKIARHACKAEWQKRSLVVMEQWQENQKSEKVSFPEPGIRPPTPERDRGNGSDKQRQIAAWLVSRLAERLGQTPEAIAEEEPFASYGLDSVQAVRLTAELEDWLGCQLSPTLAYDYPTIDSLSAYLAQLNEPDAVSLPDPLAPAQEIAIVGIGCRFPGADSPDAFWQLLRDGKEAVSPVAGRWEGEDWGGFLGAVDQFDAGFFGISPREAQRLDPQQRLLLEIAWETLENAGISPTLTAGSPSGVFIGISSSDYANLQLRSQLGVDAYSGTGNAHSIAANRLSYFLDWRGPSLAVDTACSSSLVAVHLACQSLRQGECALALAGGVNLMLSPELTQTFNQAGMMAADGRCKTFDASADGYVRGEGCGLVLLKPLEQALKDRDRIWGVIKGTALNQDGRSNGLTAPNGRAQQAVIQQALANGRVAGSAISYVEAHGTGTALGDPIEVNSLQAVLAPGREWPCFLGSVKTNIGHLEAAAGIAGLIKVLLSLQQRAIPPHLHFQALNPHIALKDGILEIPSQLQPWPQDRPRLAGVSSFGFGGTNAHIIVGDGPDSLPLPEPTLGERPWQVLTLSAKSERALGDLGKAYQDLLAQGAISLGNLGFSANTGRSGFDHRLALVARSQEQLQNQLQAFVAGEEAAGLYGGQVHKGNSKIAFLFSGQGSQFAGMGEQLYQTQPRFRAAIDQCAEILQSYLPRPLQEILYPKTTADAHLIDETAYTQPALFALEYALVQVWLSWGIQPDIVLGHSVGEYVAACIAGVFSLEDGLRLIAERGRLMQSLPKTGAMAAIFAEPEAIQGALAVVPGVEIAAYNGSHLTVSGEAAALETLIAALRHQGIKTKRLRVSHGFHSALMEPMLAEFGEIARQVTYALPRLKFVANVTGQLAGAEVATPQYWVRHVRAAVQFEESLERLRETNCQIFLEIGPKPTLIGIGRYCLSGNELLWFASLRPGQEDWQQLLSSLAKLWLRGYPVDWAGFDADYPRKRLNLPTYPFQRQRYWLEQLNASQPVASDRLSADWFYRVQWQPQRRESAIAPVKTGRWLILGNSPFAGQVAEQFAKNSLPVLQVAASQGELRLNSGLWQLNPESIADFRQLLAAVAEQGAIAGIVHLWGLDVPRAETLAGAELEAAQRLSCGSLLHLVQALLQQSLTVPVWIATPTTQAVLESDSPQVAAASLWGLGSVLASEHPELWGGMVDLGALNPLEAAELTAELLNPSGEDRLAYRQGDRYVARLIPDRVPAPEIPLKIAPDGTYLIAGGLGALGRQVAQWLVRQGAKQLVLLGRTPPTAMIQRQLQILEQRGARILVCRGDIANKTELQAIFETITASLPPLRGVIQAAGLLNDGLLQGQTWERFAQVLAPKVLGSWNLHELTKDLSLDFFVGFSSVASLIGSPGQGNYAAANAFLDALIHQRRSQNLAGVSINWGPWELAGMAVQSRLATKGLEFLSPAQGLVALGQIMVENRAQVGIFKADWLQLSEQFSQLRQVPYWQNLIPRDSASTDAAPDLFEQLLPLTTPEREKLLIDYLRQAIAKTLQLPPENLAPSDNLLDTGMDSLMVMEAINQLKSDLKLMLYPREFYERPRLEALAPYLAAEFAKIYDTTTKTTATPVDLSVIPAFAAVSPSPTAVEKLPPIAFILGSPRCGSTLLRVMLAGHSQLLSPPELHLLPFATLQERASQLSRSHLDEGLQRTLMALKAMDAQASRLLLERWLEENLEIRQIYAQLIQLAGKRLLVDKSPTYGFHQETLARAEALFAGAKYIHLVRHPYAVIDSFARLRMDKLLGIETDNPYPLAETIWAKSNQNILDFLAAIDSNRQHQIRYEELVTQPETVMQRLCEFLAIDFEAALLEPYEGDRLTDGVSNKSLSLGDPNFRKRQQIDPKLAAAWRNVQLPQSLSLVSAQLAARFAYELPQPAIAPDVTFVETELEVRGLKLCLCQWGPEDGPLVLCLHGILEQGTEWEPTAIALAQQGYRVVAPDLRGHGRSEHVGRGGAYNLLDFLSDVDGVANHLGQPSILVGHSLGAVIASLFASIRSKSVKSLVLVEPVLPADGSDREAAQQLVTHLNYLAAPPEHPVFTDLTIAADRLRATTPVLSLEFAQKLAARLTEPCEGGICWRWDKLLRTRTGIGFNGISRSKYLRLLGEIQAPVTLIYGDRSNFNRPEDLQQQQAALPQAEPIVLPGGHNLHLEVPHEIARIISQTGVKGS